MDTATLKFSHDGALVIIFSLFAISILVALVGAQQTLNPRRSQYSYYFSIISALLLSAGMVYLTGSGLRMVNFSSESDVVTLGFAHIYYDTFIESESPEWILSLTSNHLSQFNNPNIQNRGSDRPVTRGLGAPLWVVFLSVIGSALFTLALIVKEIRSPPDFVEEHGVRNSLQSIVQHQFFIIFSPLGGILLYQTLVLAKAASEPVTVAFVALGAGISLNAILSRAVSASSKWLGKNNENEKDESKK